MEMNEEIEEKDDVDQMEGDERQEKTDRRRV